MTIHSFHQAPLPVLSQTYDVHFFDEYNRINCNKCVYAFFEKQEYFPYTREEREERSYEEVVGVPIGTYQNTRYCTECNGKLLMLRI